MIYLALAVPVLVLVWFVTMCLIEAVHVWWAWRDGTSDIDTIF